MLSTTQTVSDQNVLPPLLYYRIQIPVLLLCVMHTQFCAHYTREYYTHGMQSLYPCIMCIFIFPSKIWANKCTLYTAKYGILLINQCPCHLFQEVFLEYPSLGCRAPLQNTLETLLQHLSQRITPGQWPIHSLIGPWAFYNRKHTSLSSVSLAFSIVPTCSRCCLHSYHWTSPTRTK